MYYLNRFSLILLTVLCSIYSLSAQANKPQVQNFNTKQPSRFTENKGQITDQNGNLRPDVKYIYSAPGFKAIFKANSFSYEVFTVEKKPNQISEATGKPIEDNLLADKFKQPEDVTVKTHRIDIDLPGANKYPEIIVEGKSSDYNNYYLAHTPEEGVQKIYSYTKLTYKNIWPKVDIVFYAKREGELKYDIVVHPGGKLSDVKFTYDGANTLKLAEGKLSLQTSLGIVKEQIPLSYTQQDKKRVDVSYKAKQNTVSFSGNYNLVKTLVIDPAISWATYYGGDSTDICSDISTDNFGNVYLVGFTLSSTNISSSNAFKASFNNTGNLEGYIIKFNSRGQRIWATYYGGKDFDRMDAVTNDISGNVIVGGLSTSTDGVATTGSFRDTIYGTEDMFIAKFDSAGKRLWATYYGGEKSDAIRNITSDKFGNIYIAGSTSSTKSISTLGAHQNKYGGGNFDGFLTKFNTNGNRIWSTYYGGNGKDNLTKIAVNAYGDIFLLGVTSSSQSISTMGSHQVVYGGGDNDFYIVKLDSSGNRSWATYYGGSGYEINGSLKVDKSNNLFLSGATSSKSAIATATATAYRSYLDGTSDAMLVKFDSTGKRVWGTYFGGEKSEGSNAHALDSLSNIYVVGTTSSLTGIATIDANQSAFGGANDAFLMKFDSSGAKIRGTYYGGSGEEGGMGIAIDNLGNIFYMGPAMNGSELNVVNAYQDSFGGGDEDIFIINALDMDAGILSIDSVLSQYCGNSLVKEVYVQVSNFSYDVKLDNISIGWSINNSIQKPLKYAKPIDSRDTSGLIKLGKIAFNQGVNRLKVWTYDPNGNLDGDHTNDTLNKTVSVDSTCVWPGDANADKVVDNKDILAIGVAYSDTGSSRTDTSTAWKEHFVKDWINNFASGANYKHADTDGNGVVSSLDTNAVTRNYGKTHFKKEDANRGKNTDPVLRVEIQNDSLKAGDVLIAYVILGESSLPAKDVYGLAFSLNYNKDYFSSVAVDYTGNWFGTKTLGYSNRTNGLDLALTKTDHNNSTGSGKIATIRFTLNKDQQLDIAQLKLEIVDNILISANEQVIPTNVKDDSVKVYKEPNGIYYTNTLEQNQISVYPNPFTGQTNVEYTLQKSSTVSMMLYDITGKSYVVNNTSTQPQGKHTFKLDTNPYNLTGGVYILKVTVDGIPIYKRIIKTR